jgi:hypothetical protein
MAATRPPTTFKYRVDNLIATYTYRQVTLASHEKLDHESRPHGAKKLTRAEDREQSDNGVLFNDTQNKYNRKLHTIKWD